jgi:hypothetical protein
MLQAVKKINEAFVSYWYDYKKTFINSQKSDYRGGNSGLLD